MFSTLPNTNFNFSVTFNQSPDDIILDRSNLKQSADVNVKFDENSMKFSKSVENTVGKGEIAHNEQFLLFPQCFQKACFLGVSKGVVVWEWVNLSSASSFKLDQPKNCLLGKDSAYWYHWIYLSKMF